MGNQAAVRITVYGYVQGVFFRAFTEERARRLGLTGYVRNLLGEPAVEVQAEGERDKLETLLGYLKVGPPSARVATITTQWSEYTGSYSDFTVRY